MPRTTRRTLTSGWEITRSRPNPPSERASQLARAMVAPTLAVPALILVGILCLALGGCATTPEGLPTPPRVVRICPDVKPYTAAFQDQLRTEIRSIAGTHPATVEVVGDYLGMRDAARKCAEGSNR